jgi:hypothetical protein
MAAASLPRLSPARADEVTQWWRRLAPNERRALRADAGRPPPRVVVRFVEAGHADDDPDASTDFYEHLVNHEIVIDDGPRYHICTAHPAARAAVAAGRIPAAFRCPRGRSDSACPMRGLLDRAPGCDVRFSLLPAERPQA